WSDRFNWTGDTVPGTSDVAVVDQFVTLTVTLDTDASVAGLQVGGAAETQTFDASNHNLTVSGGAQVFAHGAITFANTQIVGNLTNGGVLNVISSGVVTGTLLNQATGTITIGGFTFCGSSADLR